MPITDAGQIPAKEGSALAVATKQAQAPTYQMGLFETDKFVTTPKVARAFGIAPVVHSKTGEVVGFANKHLKRREIAEAAGLSMGKADKSKIDGIIRESELELAAKITAFLVLHKGKIGARTFRVRRDDQGVESYSIGLRQMPDSKLVELQKLMDSYGAATPEELLEILQGKKGKVVEVEATATTTTK